MNLVEGRLPPPALEKVSTAFQAASRRAQGGTPRSWKLGVCNTIGEVVAVGELHSISQVEGFVERMKAAGFVVRVYGSVQEMHDCNMVFVCEEGVEASSSAQGGRTGEGSQSVLERLERDRCGRETK